MKKDNLFVGIYVILFTLFPIIAISIWEENTSNYLGYVGAYFLPLICLGIFLIISAFYKDK